MKNCPHCSLDLFNTFPTSNIANHIRWCIENPNRIKPTIKIKVCPECNNEHGNRGKYCSEKCSSVQISKPETRKKISDRRKKFLKENPDKHPWKKDTKKISEPCEKLKEYLRNKNISFVEEWQPLENRFYSIDIAFPDIKFGIEVNGNQHYNRDGTLTNYYQERHDLIEKEGWKLLELHYSSCYNTNLLDSILQFGKQPDYTDYFKLKELKEIEKNKNKPLKRGEKIKRKTDIKWESYKSVVLESNIDFSKFGWVKAVALLLNIKDQKVCNWMRRYLPEFYEKTCFKRKISARITTAF